jgi:glycosyltransferase involved in cell wall biosynthesis
VKVLFLHPKFPGQFWRLAAQLARDAGNEITFITEQQEDRIAGVEKLVYELPATGTSPHPFLGKAELSVLHSYAAAEAANALKRRGYVPDVVYGYAGAWSNALFARDVFPDTPLLGYFEWFVESRGGEYNFDPAYMLNSDQEYAVRCSNMANWVLLHACSRGVSPTEWQRSRFPREFQRKIEVIFDGVDTEYYKPDAAAVFTVPATGASFSTADEVVTYATRGMEPMRGFHKFMEAAALIQQRRPRCHIVVAGSDGAWYSKGAEGNRSHKDVVLERLPFDRDRLHFTGWLDRDRYRQLLRVSTAHVYLTRPYVLSWSAMEALATGCLVVGSDTPPVTEMIRHGDTGLLADFFSPEDIAAKVCGALANREDMRAVRANARALICERYSLPVVLPRQAALLKSLAGGKA